MGGLGSGIWLRHGVREYLDDHISIDIRYLKRKGWLDEEYHTNITWSCDGVTTDRIFVFTEPNVVTFKFTVQNNSGAFFDKEISVSLTCTNGTYGGQRPWFMCPSCDRRVALLYKAEQSLKCRKCCNLPYECQSETGFGRLQRRKHIKFRELKIKYGMEFPLHSKPKGMHRETYQRIRKEAIQLWVEHEIAMDAILDEIKL